MTTPRARRRSVALNRNESYRYSMSLSSQLVAYPVVAYDWTMPKLWTDTIETHRREVRDAVLDAAADLIAENGLLDVTMSRIAEETGIGRNALQVLPGRRIHPARLARTSDRSAPRTARRGERPGGRSRSPPPRRPRDVRAHHQRVARPAQQRARHVTASRSACSPCRGSATAPTAGPALRRCRVRRGTR